MTDQNQDQPQASMSRRGLLSAVAIAPLAAGVVVETASAETARGGTGKAAIVTGSSRGIGAAVAKRLGREGYTVTVNFIVNRDLADAVVRDIESAGGKAIAVQADISDPDAVRRLFDENDKAFGGVDVVVANAGIIRQTPMSDMTDENFNRLVDVNMKGGFYTMREAARRVRDNGRIITLSSTVAHARLPASGPYGATKAAQEIYANVLAKELAGRMISVNAIAPGPVNTTLFTDLNNAQAIAGFVQRTPHHRLGEPEDIANVVAALCSSDGMWVNGQTILANGGLI
ncbi:short-chain dehydrogenase/reductase SDR family protein (plasmid) [Rhizobium sp. CIAT894]|uniref:SDR family oxidoreductase n=1 Tax=Rhizobium sp. CIAT894 TaxID=2020312 RepID=UPI000A1F099F|nr:SDR family oxidoreductase [Rhizobium sp. CIAT894]ARM91944.1 short-chain dehydrogenase/reductase SDR family protein [Rhizobium sp. CIAT894]